MFDNLSDVSTDGGKQTEILHVGLSENVVYPIVPNGFADPYPY